MVFVEEQNSVYSGQSDSMNEKKESDKMTAEEKRKRKIQKKLRCRSWRLSKLAIPRYRVEKYSPKPYQPIELKPPEPLDSDLEEKLTELSQPMKRIVRENKFAHHQLFENREKRKQEILNSGRLQKSKNVISDSKNAETTK